MEDTDTAGAAIASWLLLPAVLMKLIEKGLLSLQETRDLIDLAQLGVETRDQHEDWQTPDRKAAAKAASQHLEALWQLVGSGS